MFNFCPIEKINCPHCGQYKGELHCGETTGKDASTKISHLHFCPKKPKTKTNKN